MVHNTACKASEVFEAETAFAVEDFPFDLIWQKHKEKYELSDFCDFCNKVMKDALDSALLQPYFLLGECSALWGEPAHDYMHMG